MDPSSGGGQVAPIFVVLLVTSTPPPSIAGLAAAFIFALLSVGAPPWTSAPSTVGGLDSRFICVLAPAGLGNTSATVAELAANLINVAAASVVRDIVAALAAGIFLHAASSIRGSAASSILAGIVTESTSRAVLFSPPHCDWLVLFLVLLSPREICGRDAAVFEVLAEAY
jgi:hypothetical protein